MAADQIRGALLQALMRKRGLEQQLEQTERQIDALLNQLAVFEHLEKSTPAKEPSKMDQETGQGGSP